MHNPLSYHRLPVYCLKLASATRDFRLNFRTIAVAAIISLSCLISVRVSQLMGLSFSFWAGYACIRVYNNCRSITLERSVMRVAGTVAALIIVIMLASWIHSRFFMFTLILAIVAFAFYLACHRRHASYFYIMFAITVLLFLHPFITSSSHEGVETVYARTVETLLGSLIMLVLIYPLLKKSRKAFHHPKTQPQIKQNLLFTATFIILVIVAFIATLPLKQVIYFEQAVIGIIAVMCGFEEIQIKHLSILRFSGCFIGILFAATAIILHLGGFEIWLFSFFSLLLFALIVQQSKDIAYLGAQAVLCYLTTTYATIDNSSISHGIERLTSTFITLMCIFSIYGLFLLFRKITKQKFRLEEC
ncbi:MAG: FUSC family protein [Francisellaceae bacterium]